MRATRQIEDSADDGDEPGAYRTGNDGQRRRRVLFATEARRLVHKTGEIPVVIQKMSIDCFKMVVYNDVCVTTKGKLGHEMADMVNLYAHFVLLNKYSGRLE